MLLWGFILIKIGWWITKQKLAIAAIAVRLPRVYRLLFWHKYVLLSQIYLIHQALNLSKNEVQNGFAFCLSFCSFVCVGLSAFVCHLTPTPDLFSINEPTHEIMALIALHNLNLKTRMRSNPLGLHVRIWSDPSSTSIRYVCEQPRLWRDCADAQSRLSLRCSPML